MIQWMHRLSQSWLASLLMGAVALSFVVWGIADIFTGQTSTNVATVGSTSIDASAFQRFYRDYLRVQSQQMRTEITPEMAQKLGLGDNALRQLLSQTALNNEAARLHLTVSDAAIASNVRDIPSFKGATGQFDHDQFLRAIQSAGYTEASFLDEIRGEMTRNQLMLAVSSGFALPDDYTKALYQFFTERRAADYVVVTPDAAGPTPVPNDAVLLAYVKAHANLFATPEYREVSYAQIGPQDLAGQFTPTESQITQAYEANKATYQVPEKRDIQQIEFTNEADAQAALAKIRKGESFEQLAAERKIKPADLDLGNFGKSDLDAARGDAVFALKQGDVSQPVKSAAGSYTLLRVQKIVPAINQSVADVHDAIKKDLALQQAGGKLADVINAYEDARSGGADIPTAAKKVGMKSGRIASIDKNGLGPDGQKIADLPSDPEFLAQAFTVEEGEDNDPFQAKSGEYFAVKVTGHTASKPKTLDQVRGPATAAWQQEQRTQALTKKASELASQAARDKSLTGIAATLKTTIQHSPALVRQTDDATFSAAFVERLFSLPMGGIQMGPQGSGANFLIAQVTGISHTVTPDMQAALDQGKKQLSQQVVGDLMLSYSNAVQMRQGAKIDQRVLQSVIGTGQ